MTPLAASVRRTGVRDKPGMESGPGPAFGGAGLFGRADGAQGAGSEVPAKEYQHDPGRNQRENRRMEEPGERGECEKITSKPTVQMKRRKANDRRCPFGMGLGAVWIGRRGRGGADQDRTVVGQPESPGELEEGVDEDRHQQQHLHVPYRLRGRNRERQRGEGFDGLLRGTQDRDQSGHQKNRRRGKKS